MGRASSSKKVARVARAGGRGASTGPKRNLGFPALIALIIVLGISLVVFARSSRDEASATPPTLTDHWHAAYEVSICGEPVPPFQSQEDPDGIHSHADGVIHIHPFTSRVAGDNARLSVFLETMGAEVTDDRIALDDGTSYVEGEDDCAGEPAIVQIARWPNADDTTTPPEIITENVADVQFDGDREAITIAFAPEGTEIPPPSSIPQLDQLTDVQGQVPGATNVPTTAVPGGATVPAAPASTEPPTTAAP